MKEEKLSNKEYLYNQGASQQSKLGSFSIK